MGAAFGTNDPPPPDDWGCLSFRRGWRVFGELVSVGGFTGTEFRRPPPGGHIFGTSAPPSHPVGAFRFAGGICKCLQTGSLVPNSSPPLLREVPAWYQ